MRTETYMQGWEEAVRAVHEWAKEVSEEYARIELDGQALQWDSFASKIAKEFIEDTV